MPPRRDTSSDDHPPSLADSLAQLIQVSTEASQSNIHTNAQLAALITATENLNTKLDTQSATTARLVNHIAELSDTLHTADNHHQPPPHEPPPPPPHGPPPPPPLRPHRPSKISLPMFDGSNPLGWIFQAENYFTYFQVPHPDRVSFTAFHCTGDALSWYQNLSANNLLGTWPEFKRKLELRFGPSSFENHEAALFKLQQTSTVSEYLAAFEKLSNRITGLSAQTLLNCFLSGLKPSIRAELAIHQPQNLHAATGLAKLLEDKFNNRPSYGPRSSNVAAPITSPTTTSITSTSTTPNPNTPKSSTIGPLLPTPSKPLPFHKLSPEAIQQRRKDGLCFRCPSKYSPGHVCSPPQFLFIVDDGLPVDLDPPPLTEDTTIPSPEFMALSPADFCGMSSPQTLRLTGYIQGKSVTVLIDCGSTHNIMQPRVASALSVHHTAAPPFPVMVGNGQYIHCEGYCPSTPVTLHKATFDLRHSWVIEHPSPPRRCRLATHPPSKPTAC